MRLIVLTTALVLTAACDTATEEAKETHTGEPLIWQFDDVRIEDGTPVAGYLLVDGDRETLIDFEICVGNTQGATADWGPWTYTLDDAAEAAWSNDLGAYTVTAPGLDANAVRRLSIYTDPDHTLLPAFGSPVDIAGTECDDCNQERALWGRLVPVSAMPDPMQDSDGDGVMDPCDVCAGDDLAWDAPGADCER